MTIKRMFAVGAAALFAVACQKGASQAQESAKPQTAAKPPAAAAASDGDLTASTVIAEWTEAGATKKLTYGELKEARSSVFLKLERERYNAVRRELEGYILDQLMNAEAKKAGQTQDAYIDSLAAKVPAEEVKKFYETTVAKGGKGPAMDQVEGRIRQYLSMKVEVDRVKKAAAMKVTLPEPEVPVATFSLEGRPFKGPADAKVTIVEFSDFQCPYCARANEPVEEIVKAFPKDVKVYFMHFPLSFHQQAMPAAKASVCAQKQGKFWEMHDEIFANQSTMSDEDLKKHAEKVGLDIAKYDTCFADPATEAYVKADMAQGTKAGVGGTPSFYVNGKQQQGPPSVDAIRAVVEG